MACVDLPALPLQLLLRERADFRGHPAAVVAEDRPQAPLLWVDERARRAGIRPGQRWAAALALDARLRAAPVAPAAIETATRRLVETLRRFSPEVEPARDEPGVFWLSARGLGLLFPSLDAWAHRIREALAGEGFRASVVVGWSRFGTYAVARSLDAGGTVRVFADEKTERTAALRVPLSRLHIEPATRDALERLGVLTVGDFLRLPAAGLAKRFGDDALRLHRLARGDLWTPLRPAAAVEPVERRIELPAPETDVERLVFVAKRLLDELLDELAARGEAVLGLELSLLLDRGRRPEERAVTVRPAEPTLDTTQLLGLLRLRLETLRLEAGVLELGLAAESVRVAAEQGLLFGRPSRRDPAAGRRAFARLRARAGAEDVVVRARLVDAHLPRARFVWEPLERIETPRPRRVAVRTLVRRIFHRPLALPPRGRREPDGWLLRGLEHGPVRAIVGPYVLSGGWWSGREVHREYSFARMQDGDVLWIYYDRWRRRWFLEGRVE